MKSIISSMIGISGALFLMGCASSDYEDTDHAYTETETEVSETSTRMVLSDDSSMEIVDASGAERASAPASTPVQSGNEWVIPLHEEQMNVGKRSVDSGEVTIRKVVTSEQVSQPVELRRETLSIEREPAGASRESAVEADAGLFQEKAVTIQLQEEQPVVEKTTVQTGQVRARKNAEVETREIQGEVRREDVQVDRSGESSENP